MDQWTDRQMDGPKDGHNFLCRRTDELMYLIDVSFLKLVHIYNADFS